MTVANITRRSDITVVDTYQDWRELMERMLVWVHSLWYTLAIAECEMSRMSYRCTSLTTLTSHNKRERNVNQLGKLKLWRALKPWEMAIPNNFKKPCKNYDIFFCNENRGTCLQSCINHDACMTAVWQTVAKYHWGSVRHDNYDYTM